MELEPFWHHFWTTVFFIFLILKTFFSINFFFENFPQFAPGGEVFCDHHYFQLISARDLKFELLKLKLLITFDLLAVDNVRGNICNQHILIVTILRKIKGPKKSTPTYPPTHSDNEVFRGSEKGRFTLVLLKSQFSLPNANKIGKTFK